eukprot:NODE_66_length_25735_cov_0.318497.p8 type:complete len:408 gc:universal NODE_66_length_25735_cov_0.318497:22591-23814(+)
MELEQLTMEFEHVELTNADIIDKFLSLSCPKIDQVIEDIILQDYKLFLSRIKLQPNNFIKFVTNNKEFITLHFDDIIDHVLSDVNEYNAVWNFLVKHFPRKSINNTYKYINDQNILQIMDPIFKLAMEDGCTEESNSYESKEIVLLSSIKESLSQSNILFSILNDLERDSKYIILFKHMASFYADLLLLMMTPQLTDDIYSLFLNNMDIAIEFSDLLCQKIAYPVLDMSAGKEFVESTVVDISNDYLNLLNDSIIDILCGFLRSDQPNTSNIPYNSYIVHQPLNFQYVISLRILNLYLHTNPNYIYSITNDLWTIWIEFFTKYPHNTQFHFLFFDIIKMASSDTNLLDLIFIKLEFIKYLIIIKNKNNQHSDSYYYMTMICKLLNDHLQNIPEICDFYGWEQLLMCS